MVRFALRNVDRSAPWGSLGSWSREFDHLFGEMDRMLTPLRSAGDSKPTGGVCDVHESEGGYLLSMDLPGVPRDDINVECTGNRVTVAARRKPRGLVEGVSAHRVERNFGQIERSFMLPESVEASKIEAHHEDGVLYLHLPKAEVAKTQKINIESGRSGFLRTLEGGDKATKAKAANI